jgi:GWxTD domain-containing protein
MSEVFCVPKSRSPLILSLLFLVTLFLFGTDLLHASGTKPKLPLYYKQWIDEDVPYIITQGEHREFLALQTDDERDRFIEQFWESRNPTPHDTINTLKEEHYRRLAYVRTEFGDDRYNDGWRTDMGRIYITLGAPQQKATYHQGMSTRPVEIWFYQSPSPALPAYFNLVFYKKSEADPYTLYSPREDGPTKIVTNDEHNESRALKTIDKAMGSEATHAMVSLIPGEPIDIDHPNPTMSSDLMLDAIRNLPEQKLEKDRINRQRTANREVVNSTIFSGFHAIELQTVVLRDQFGLSTVHYIVTNRQPDPTIIGTLPDKKPGYHLTLTTHVITDAGAPIYERKEELAGHVSPAGATAGSAKKFAVEGRLPLVPGNYVVESVMTNELTRDSARASTRVSVPARQADTIAMSGLMVYRGNALKTSHDQLPFTLAGLRFPPRGEQLVELHPGESLPLVFQLWLPPTNAAAIPTGAKAPIVHIHYTLGSVALSGAGGGRIDQDQDVLASDVDTVGNLVTGNNLDTTALAQGTYRLVVRATESGSSHSAFATMTIKVVSMPEATEMWSAYSDDQQHPQWQDDLLRGLAAEAQQDNRAALAAYQRALAMKPGSGEVQTRLDLLNKKLAKENATQR